MPRIIWRPVFPSPEDDLSGTVPLNNGAAQSNTRAAAIDLYGAAPHFAAGRPHPRCHPHPFVVCHTALPLASCRKELRLRRRLPLLPVRAQARRVLPAGSAQSREAGTRSGARRRAAGSSLQLPQVIPQFTGQSQLSSQLSSQSQVAAQFASWSVGDTSRPKQLQPRSR